MTTIILKVNNKDLLIKLHEGVIAENNKLISSKYGSLDGEPSMGHRHDGYHAMMPWSTFNITSIGKVIGVVEKDKSPAEKYKVK